MIAAGDQRSAIFQGDAERLLQRLPMCKHGRARVPVAEGNFTHDGGEAAMLALLDNEPDLDGIDWAIGAPRCNGERRKRQVDASARAAAVRR